MKKIIFFFILFNYFTVNALLIESTEDILNQKEIDPNSINSGIKFLFDGTNLLLFEDNSITGINYLLESISTLFFNSLKSDENTNEIKNEAQELITKLKYQITVLINSSFKVGECDKKNLINYEQKNKIVDAIKNIFYNVLSLSISSSSATENCIKALIKLEEIVSLIFSCVILLDGNCICNNSLKDISNTKEILIAKLKSLKFERQKNSIIEHEELISGVCQIFNCTLDLKLESDLNSKYYKGTMRSLSKIIKAILSVDIYRKRGQSKIIRLPI